MKEKRPATPLPVERALRQEAGFGCAKCGFPIYDYHHIVEYSDEEHFRIEDMLILCPNCHREATVGAMPELEQRKYKSKPYNLLRGYAEGQLKTNQHELAISTGGVQFVNNGTLLSVDDESLLSVEIGDHGNLEITLSLYDDNDNLLLQIDRNRWLQGDSNLWDIEFGYNWLIIRHHKNKIALKIDARTEPLEIRADFWRKGQFFRLNKVGLIHTGVVSKVAIKDLCFVGQHINVNVENKQLSVKTDKKYLQGSIISWPDFDERMRKAHEAFNQLKKSRVSE